MIGATRKEQGSMVRRPQQGFFAARGSRVTTIHVGPLSGDRRLRTSMRRGSWPRTNHISDRPRGLSSGLATHDDTRQPDPTSGGARCQPAMAPVSQEHALYTWRNCSDGGWPFLRAPHCMRSLMSCKATALFPERHPACPGAPCERHISAGQQTQCLLHEHPGASARGPDEEGMLWFQIDSVGATSLPCHNLVTHRAVTC